MGISLYHMPMSRSLRVQWLLEELCIDHNIEIVEFNPKGHGGEAYQKHHPLNIVPALVDGGTTILESVAILQYLMGKYGSKGLDRQASDPDFAAYLQFLHYGESSLTSRVANMMDEKYFFDDAKKNPEVVKHIEKKITDLLSLLETQLGDHDYILASGFSAADISVGYGLFLAKIAKCKHLFSPRIQTYYSVLTARPVWAKLTAR